MHYRMTNSEQYDTVTRQWWSWNAVQRLREEHEEEKNRIDSMQREEGKISVC